MSTASLHRDVDAGWFRDAVAPHLVTSDGEAWRMPANGDIGENPAEVSTLPLKDAAVLFGVVDRPGGATVLLTTRVAELRSHAGQVALPGGRIDPTDRDAMATALRETHEEIGLGAAAIDPLGYFAPYVSRSGYRIMPVVGVITPGYHLTLNPAEVANAFEVPLGFLLDQNHHRIGSRVWMGHERFYYEMPWHEHYIWGVTAGIIRRIAEQVGTP